MERIGCFIRESSVLGQSGSSLHSNEKLVIYTISPHIQFQTFIFGAQG